MFKSNTLEVFQAKENDVSSSDAKDDEYFAETRSNSDSDSMKDRDANASVSKLNQYHAISGSDNLSASKCEVSSFSGDENSASRSNVSDVSSFADKSLR